MGYMTDGLTFNTLRSANLKRLPQFKDAKGRDGHCASWTPADWMTALVGELGEAANILKKIKRGDFELDKVRDDLADELADVQTYLDILAANLGIDLGRATITKFNRISDRILSRVKIREDGSDWRLSD